MHRLTAMKEISSYDTPRLAEATGDDPVAIFMFEQGATPAHYHFADRLCAAMDVPLAEMFPDIREILDLAESLDSEADVQDLFFEPANRMALRSVGLDPDLREWVMIVDLKSGNERRYRLASPEVDKVRSHIVNAKDASGYICFYSDCQQVILWTDAITEIRFVVGASYAPFNSREKAYVATMVFDDSPRPEQVLLAPDGGEDGEGDRPFALLLDAAINGRDLPPFIRVEAQDDDERYVSVHGLEAIELPMGVIFPEIYDKDGDARYVGLDSGLGGMDTQGNA